MVEEYVCMGVWGYIGCCVFLLFIVCFCCVSLLDEPKRRRPLYIVAYMRGCCVYVYGSMCVWLRSVCVWVYGGIGCCVCCVFLLCCVVE